MDRSSSDRHRGRVVRVGGTACAKAWRYATVDGWGKLPLCGIPPGSPQLPTSSLCELWSEPTWSSGAAE